MTEAEVVKIVKSEINKFISDKFDDEMKKNLHRSGSKSRNELVKTMKDSLESVFKVLWQKKDFWKTDIK